MYSLDNTAKSRKNVPTTSFKGSQTYEFTDVELFPVSSLLMQAGVTYLLEAHL